MAHQITLEEAASRLPDLVQEAKSGQEVVFLDGLRPVARLLPLSDDAPTAQEIAALAMAGGAFDWLADEPDLYDDTQDKVVLQVRERLRQWQQEYGLPTRPDGKQNTSAEELFAQWSAEDAGLTPEEAQAEQEMWKDLQQNRQSVTI